MKPSAATPGARLRQAIVSDPILPLIGVYDAFSATIAARHFPGLFVSGFSFAASHYGLPDIGFIAWSDVVAFVQRLRAILPRQHLLVDIDDGYCDTVVACQVVRQLEALGASGVVLEDQQRPRRCGHLDGKQLMPLDAFLEKLAGVLAARQDLVVVARTDAVDEAEVVRRAMAFAEAGADAILLEAVKDIDTLSRLSQRIPAPIVFNQIAGGLSPRVSLSELEQAGVSLVNYSTPCLFAAQSALEETLSGLARSDGRLPESGIGVHDCNALLHGNLGRLTDSSG